MLVFTSKSAKFLYESIILSYSNSLLLGTQLLGQAATRCCPNSYIILNCMAKKTKVSEQDIHCGRSEN